MREIIDGKRYDTDKADELGAWSTDCGVSDFNHTSEALYRTPRSGRYFLAGEGGPMSRYAVSLGQGGWRGGEKITPLTDEEAFAWAQDSLDADEVERLFSDQIEDA